MSITDELREYVDNFYLFRYEDVREKLDAIADRIDEQREKDALGEYTRGYNAGFNAASDGCESADELRERIEREYIKLPVDANGVPIRIGDTMEWLDGSTANVIGIGNGVFFYKDDESDGADWSSAENKRHHHEQTVEDVLREFAEHWNDPAHYAKGELVEQYAAKLRLAEEAE